MEGLLTEKNRFSSRPTIQAQTAKVAYLYNIYQEVYETLSEAHIMIQLKSGL